ncbi:hypothetical protein CFB84_36190 [Burkholderia aenigmatica]|uniref:Uncharacterized protein n=1 Tax=Burkholderia aenigmatica TaxID=2015348 RepID=A0A228I083_9BURK|nr:hypothetical protein CFB84_36190 [Burkholderia aenigmatica]
MVFQIDLACRSSRIVLSMPGSVSDLLSSRGDVNDVIDVVRKVSATQDPEPRRRDSARPIHLESIVKE